MSKGPEVGRGLTYFRNRRLVPRMNRAPLVKMVETGSDCALEDLGGQSKASGFYPKGANSH